MGVDRKATEQSRVHASLAHALDLQAETREVAYEIQKTSDTAIRSGLLERLLSLLESHFAKEESGDVLQAIAERSNGGPAAADQLIREHREILSVLRDLVRRVRTGGTQSLVGLAGEVEGILQRLGSQDARETALFRDIVGTGKSSTVAPIRSEALEVNLRRTAVEVPIPPDQEILLTITSDRRGVHDNTKNLLREINHRYVGWEQTLADLHRRATSDFSYYVTHERASEAIEVFCFLYARAVREASPASLRETALRWYLYYLEKVAEQSGDRLPALLPSLQRALDDLERIFERDPFQATVSSPQLKRFAQALLRAALETDCAAVVRSLELLSSVLRETYREWLAREDPVSWWRKATGAEDEATPPDEVAAIAHRQFEYYLGELDRLASGVHPGEPHAAVLFALPDQAQIERAYLEAASCVELPGKSQAENQLERIYWLIHVLSSQALASVHEQALSEISHLYGDVIRDADGAHLDRLVRETFSALRSSSILASQSALSLISRVGTEVMEAGDPDRTQVVVDEILEWDFPRPEFSGFTEEWGVKVNPAHLRAIRAYLAVIEANPQLARRLVAGLVVHLKIGGVFVADTDLFQKDISKLLNSDIGPVYHKVKHLLKLFPVYFSDIGAEGELREISSQIDEIDGRKDLLCHFLRKQSHVESNPRLVDFIEAIARFWATGEQEAIRPYVPEPLYDHVAADKGRYDALPRVFEHLAHSQDGAQEGYGALFSLDAAEIDRRLLGVPVEREVDREKVALLFRLRQLVGHKYELCHDDLLERLKSFHPIEERDVELLRSALAEQRHEDALEVLLHVLEQLKTIILSGEETEGFEDIFRKRHIAAGIPSMYGRYREEKFEAVGLTFRVESLANVLFERVVSSDRLRCVTRSTLRQVVRWLNLMLRGLRIDGFHGRGLAAGIDMLEQALVAEGTTVHQYINIFQVMSRSVEQVIRIRFLQVYQTALKRILHRMLQRGVLPFAEGCDERETILKLSEKFLRDMISASLGLQQCDNLVGEVLRALVQAREDLDPKTLELLMTLEPERCCVAIGRCNTPLEGPIHLGNKGYMVERLAREGLPVPPGCILTTEVFRCHPAILASKDVFDEISAQIRQEIARLERETGSRFGDPQEPLLLSVRSGAAISMPGMLDTFLNVGINTEIAEGHAAQSGSEWGAWDAYRRFLQHWGMGHGLGRGSFDLLIRDTKRQFGAAKKSQLSAAQMRELALRYRDFLGDRGVGIIDDPFAQLLACTQLVLQSWNSEKARIYRSEFQIAEEWGTAVILQAMVYGNLDQRSGTGVMRTISPRETTEDVVLHGDYTIQSQGDDVVSGLVETFPISERQRLEEAASAPHSLQSEFPQIYEALYRHACTLIHDLGMFHQEVEFTFESEDPADLYILQTRDTVMSQVTSVAVFVPTQALEEARLASGIGTAGGALSGRVAHTAEDIKSLRARFQDDPIILLRPDTVPDDIPLIVQVDGIVTARGGATSHAAVVAQQLGRACVVGCRELEVYEEEGRSLVAGRVLETAEFLSINGIDGSVYLGQHSSTMVQRRQFA
jgi:pyruvate,orthophosphate dikinase